MRKRGAIWYAVGSAIIIAGMAGAIAGALRDVSGLDAKFTRFAMPGSVKLTLAQAGTYAIYYERRSVIKGVIFQTPQTTDIKCSVTTHSGEKIEINPSVLGSATYTFEGREGTTLAEFSVPAAGTYQIACAYPSGSGARVALAVAPSLGGEPLAALFKWLALAVGSLGVGLSIFIFALMRRADAQGEAA